MSISTTRSSETVLRISAAAALVATVLCTTANAEYRCATPKQLSNDEMRACQLAQQDTPDALIHFVNRTKAIYDLYVDDYISEADVQRWELTKRRGSPNSPGVATTIGDFFIAA